MLFLDHGFTIPNFPSKLLSYMQACLPVLACTDPNTDVGKIITDGRFGWWCKSDKVDGFVKVVEQAVEAELVKMGECGYRYLEEKYNVALGYGIIEAHLGQ